MTIKLNLVLSLILEAVKAETHIKGQIDRALDDKAAKVAYQEEIGDEEFHERKIMRGIYTSLSQLETELAQYLVSKGSSVSSNVDEDKDTIVIMLDVADSFNTSLTTSLARLCSKFIEDATLVLWWGTFNANQMQYYATLQAADLAAINKCFSKSAPSKPTVPYTTSLETSGDEIHLVTGNETTITYTISEGALDDIEIEADGCIAWRRVYGGFRIIGLNQGFAHARLYSLHNEELSRDIDIIVTGEPYIPPHHSHWHH